MLLHENAVDASCIDIAAVSSTSALRSSTPCQQSALHNVRKRLTSPCFRLSSCHPVHRGCSSRGIVRAGRDAASRALPCTQHPGGSGASSLTVPGGREGFSRDLRSRKALWLARARKP